MSNIQVDNGWKIEPERSEILTIIDDLCDPNTLPSIRRKRITTDEFGKICVDNKQIPYECLPYFFEKTYSIKTINPLTSTKADFCGIKYDIIIYDKIYSYMDHTSGAKQFLKDKQLHCQVGPADISADGKYKAYYAEGILHRVDGPAIVGPDDKTSAYALYGQKLSLYDFIQANKDASTSIGHRGEASYTITYWRDYAAVLGLDGTKVLLKKSNIRLNADTFLLELISRPLKNYEVMSYTHLSKQISPIYNFIRASGPWIYDTDAQKSRLLVKEPSVKTNLTFDKEYYNLSLETNEIGPDNELNIDLGFINNKEIFPHIFIKRDKLGKKHCADGPAVRTMSGKEYYYIYGVLLTKEEFETKRHDVDKNIYYWTNNFNELSNPSIACPAEIHPNGAKYHYLDGKLHNDIFPSIEMPGEDFVLNRYFIFGNEVSPDEFIHYRWVDKEISFIDEKNLLHREDGPAHIRFNENGEMIKKYFYHGKLLNSNEQMIEYCLNKKNINQDKGLDSVEVKLKLKNPIPKSAIKTYSVKTKGEPMNVKTIKAGQTGSDASDTRMQQVGSGAKLGLKKGALKITSEKAAQALSTVLPIPQSVPTERLVQLILLIGAGEIVDRLPDGLASKVGLNSDRRTEFSGVARYVSGEILGRDAVNIVHSFAPMLLDAVRQMSAEDIADLVEDQQTIEAANHEIEEEITFPIGR